MFRLLACLLILTSFASQAQKQLVLLKNGKPVGRYVEGEYVYFVMKDGTQRQGAILELLEFAAIISVAPKADTSRLVPVDTIHYIKTQKILIPKDERRGIAPLLGGLLATSGAVYLGLDLVNSALGYNPPGVDTGVVVTSAALMGVGSSLIFIRPKYRRVGNGTIMRTVEYGSKFYKGS
ncbi:MAG: hypothetical protein JNN04_03360 [Cyclobacteriaceae bacterium]|nr:hypothetical protein [Cyclobacteriaceae bacterium]